MKTRSAHANSGAQRVVDSNSETTHEDLTRVDHDPRPSDIITRATSPSHNQNDTLSTSNTPASTNMMKSIAGTPTTSTPDKPTTSIPSTPSTSATARIASTTPATTPATTSKPTKSTPTTSVKTNKPLPATPKTPLFKTLSPIQKETRKRKLSTIKDKLRKKSVPQLTALYNSTQDPDFQTLMTEVYHENCMDRLSEWEEELEDA